MAGAAIALCIAAQGAGAAERGCPAIGAIRWDAWHGQDGPIGRHVERTLGPDQWHDRLPFCSRVLAPNKVEIECDSQEVMDREIGYAVTAGLSFWLFAAHEPGSAMGRSFDFYLSSSRKSSVNFAMYTRPRLMGTPEAYPERLARLVKLMQDPSYQKVQGNRPLVFVGFLGKEVETLWGGAERFRGAIETMRKEAMSAGLANPYIVVMDFLPERAKAYADSMGFDAITTYATRAGNPGAPYAFLARGVERFWERSRSTGAQVVPIVMTGWDDRPKAETPLRKPPPGGAGRTGFYYEQGSPAEIGEHVGNAMRWVGTHPGSSSANAVLIYAWNEHDEGGWLEPTLGEGAARVEAVGAAARRQCARP